MPFSEIIKLVRPRTLTAALSPVVLGTAFAATQYPVYRSVWCALGLEFLLLLAALLAQSATNMWNEYYDYKSGLDLTQVAGNSGSIVKGHLSPTSIRRLAAWTVGIALVCGFTVAFLTSLWLIPVGLLSIGIAYAYSGGPYPISRTPFGELASGVAMGLNIVLVACFVWTHTLHIGMLIPAIPSMILIGLILQTNSTRDIVNDKKHGRRTLAILVGRENSIRIMGAAYSFVQVWLLGAMLYHAVPWACSLAFLSIIPARKAIQIFQRYSDVRSVDEAMRYAAMTNLLYHVLFAAGLLVPIFLP